MKIENWHSPDFSCLGTGSGIREEAEEVGIDAVDDSREVRLPVQEIDFIDLYGNHLPFVMLIDEVVVELIEVLQVVELHLLLILPAPFLDILHEMRDRRPQIDHQVGHLDSRHHRLEELHVAFEVAVVEVAHPMVVDREDIDALEDAAILDDRFLRMGDLEQVLEALLEEIHLQRERPPRDILVVVVEIGVMLHGLELWNPSIVSGEHSGEGSLTAPDISCDDDVHVTCVLVSLQR